VPAAASLPSSVPAAGGAPPAPAPSAAPALPPTQAIPAAFAPAPFASVPAIIKVAEWLLDSPLAPPWCAATRDADAVDDALRRLRLQAGFSADHEAQLRAVGGLEVMIGEQGAADGTEVLVMELLVPGGSGEIEFAPPRA
jgi:hypothetical protein